MRIGILVNDPDELEARQTTTMLVARAALRGWRTYVFGVEDLELLPGRKIRAWARPVAKRLAGDRPKLVRGLRGVRPVRVDLGRFDLLLLRTNPARDPERAVAHRTALSLARLLQEEGAHVVNDPVTLSLYRGKLMMEELPAEFVVRAFASGSVEGVLERLTRMEGPVVLKPLEGTWGRGVVRLDARDRGRAEAAARELLAQEGFVLLQEYLPEASEGDTRVVVLDGEILESGGRLAAVRRIPADGDFRSNIHAGGSPAPADLTREQIRTARGLAKALLRKGIRLAGLDLIGCRALEVNVFATGGLHDSERFYGAPFVETILDRLQSPLAQVWHASC